MIARIPKIALSLVFLAVAILLGTALWHHYMITPWTRDGRVRAEVVTLAPEVAGTVRELKVADNQAVHQGDVLFVIDPEHYRLAVAQAQAGLDSRIQELRVAEAKAQRRTRLSDSAVSTEEREQFNGIVGVANAAVAEANARLALARLDLARTVIRSPVNGYVTNLRLREGDYATIGQAAVTVVDRDSFWVAGYFEETQLFAIHQGDTAGIALMGYPARLNGRVDSISRGIADQGNDGAQAGLATVNPVFTWVRLAQRIPVRIHLDELPAGLSLSAGMTCSVAIGAPPRLLDDLAFAWRFWQPGN